MVNSETTVCEEIHLQFQHYSLQYQCPCGPVSPYIKIFFVYCTKKFQHLIKLPKSGSRRHSLTTVKKANLESSTAESRSFSVCLRVSIPALLWVPASWQGMNYSLDYYSLNKPLKIIPILYLWMLEKVFQNIFFMLAVTDLSLFTKGQEFILKLWLEFWAGIREF